MDAALNLVKLYRLGSRWRASCLRRMQESLDPEALPDAHAIVTEALEAEEATCDMELQWKGHERTRLHGPSARQLDGELDRALGGLAEVLRGTGRLYGEASAEAQAARVLLARLFPQGVAAITRLAWVSQFETVDLILQHACKPELAAHLRLLRLEPALARLAELNARFYRALQDPKPPQVTFPQLAAAREAGRRRLHEVLVVLIAQRLRLDKESPEHAALTEAVDWIVGYNAAYGRYRKRRRLRRRAARGEEHAA